MKQNSVITAMKNTLEGSNSRFELTDELAALKRDQQRLYKLKYKEKNSEEKMNRDSDKCGTQLSASPCA